MSPQCAWKHCNTVIRFGFGFGQIHWHTLTVQNVDDWEPNSNTDLVLFPFLLFLQDFSYDDPKLEFNVDAPNGVVMEGYLFKRASNAFKTWNR